MDGVKLEHTNETVTLYLSPKIILQMVLILSSFPFFCTTSLVRTSATTIHLPPSIIIEHSVMELYKITSMSKDCRRIIYIEIFLPRGTISNRWPLNFWQVLSTHFARPLLPPADYAMSLAGVFLLSFSSRPLLGPRSLADWWKTEALPTSCLL